ncbi:MAG: CDP-alcohol phosphatidyltransferase family protein [Verrucomicrobia bacterium]|nr:CDP-alcohol phosphatidyltransferase family protein [Verrucomicrobiota bacterium]
MTTANKITIFRILLIPFFIAQVIYYEHHGHEWHRLAAITSFAVAAILDGVDGYVARRYNQRSELGMVLDPLADKLLLVSGVVLLSFDNGPHLDRLPLWLGITIISRDLIILIGWLLIHHFNQKVTVRPRWTGKVATVLQMATVLWGLLKWNADWWWWISLGAAVTTGVSGLLYVLDGIRQMSDSPSSSPTVRSRE